MHQPSWRRLSLITTCGALTLSLPGHGDAQEQNTPPVTLAPVEVTVTRDVARSPLELPFAITRTHPDSSRPGQRNLALDETLLLLPGVTVANRNNPTQDPRISIRGFGARSAFGVRGVRVVRDGIPLTLADGQTPTDYLDLESIGSVEVIRGTASSLYGNAGGGVVELRSSDPPRDALAVDARALGGDFGFRRWAGGLGGSAGLFRYQGSMSGTEQDGYRDYSRQRTTHGSGRVMIRGGETDFALQALAFDMPLAENPGALTRAELSQNRRMAQAFQVTKRARKDVEQSQLALVTRTALGTGELTASLYGGTRALDNPLTFAVVAIDRETYGGGLRGTLPLNAVGLMHRLSAGVDVQRLDDDRKNFANCNGVTTANPDCPQGGATERGRLLLDQRELVTSIGPYVRGEVEFGEKYHLSLGARADYIRFEIEDRFIRAGPPANPDDSGERTLKAFSPMVGFVVRLGPLTALYANVSTAFETPTATELGNREDGTAGGVNRELDPQYTTSYETGLKGIIFSRLAYDFAAFAANVRDELVPFDIPSSPGRRGFRNAGRTTRRGLEAGLRSSTGSLDLGLAYSYSSFEYEEYMVDTVAGAPIGVADFSGKRIPGIPQQQLQASATWRYRGFFTTVEGILFGSVHVNDANTVASPGYEVLNVRAGGTAVFGRSRLAPVFGVQNVLDRQYVSSVVVNAAGGRFYEPATERVVYAGLSVAVGK